MKLVSVGIDPDHIGLAADHVSAELFDILINSLSMRNAVFEKQHLRLVVD